MDPEIMLRVIHWILTHPQWSILMLAPCMDLGWWWKVQ